jgi:hypothetical protein
MTLQVGQRVVLKDSRKITRGLWGAAGTITEIKTRPESATRRNQPAIYWCKFDEPVKAISVMTGVWVEPHDVHV